MLGKIRAYIKENGMLRGKDRIVIGVSGGADSVCLFFVLLELRKEYGLDLHIVHVNHGIRGLEANEDEAFVKSLAEEHKVGFESFHADIPALAREKGMGEEEAGRLCRYQALEEARAWLGADKIALAHNQNDCAETLFFNLFRGSGLLGLSGIAPVRGRLIRPLLCLSRKEIEGWLSERGLPFRTDSTNLELAYARNRLRLHLLPVAEQEINRKAIEHTAKAAFLLREVSDYMEKQIKQAFDKNVSQRNSAYSIGNGILEEDAVLVKGVIKLALERLSGSKKDWESCHVAMVQELFFKQAGKENNLPYGVKAQRGYDGVWLRKETKPCEAPEEELELSAPGEYFLPDGRRICLELFSNKEKNSKIPKNGCTKCFDYDRIKNGLLLRHRKSGDYLQIREDGGRKKLKDDLIDRKIPRQERERLWLLADGSHIMWVLGGRTSEAYRITEETVTVLRVKLHGGNCDERED